MFQMVGATGRPTSTYGGAGLVGDSPALVAQQQLKFVDQLLRETKGNPIALRIMMRFF